MFPAYGIKLLTSPEGQARDFYGFFKKKLSCIAFAGMVEYNINRLE